MSIVYRDSLGRFASPAIAAPIVAEAEALGSMGIKYEVPYRQQEVKYTWEQRRAKQQELPLHEPARQAPTESSGGFLPGRENELSDLNYEADLSDLDADVEEIEIDY